MQYISVVMPCLNEEKSIEFCVKGALNSLKKAGYDGEVIVSDNGSKDNSVAIATKAGAHVVYQPLKGYGNAYKKGFAEAKGDILVMLDSDKTYPVEDIQRFVDPIIKGKAEFVIGNRLKGKIHPNSMPKLHKYLGNPFLTYMINFLFSSKWGDAYCGMRAFTRDAYNKMQLHTTGMEFALEMVCKASMLKLKSIQLPINYYAREKGAPSSLRSFSDGWRSVRFMLLFTPLHLFLIPGVTLLLLGLALLFLSFLNPFASSNSTSTFLPILGSFFSIVGFQAISFGYFTNSFAFEDKFIQTGMPNWSGKLTLERGLLAGFSLLLISLASGIYLLLFSNQHNVSLVRFGIIISTITIISIQIIFGSFFLSMLGIRKKINGDNH